LKPLRFSIEEVKGTSAAQWSLQLKGIEEQWVLESLPMKVGFVYSKVFWLKLTLYKLFVSFMLIAPLISDVLFS
jgi:hypothetical protein